MSTSSARIIDATGDVTISMSILPDGDLPATENQLGLERSKKQDDLKAHFKVSSRSLSSVSSYFKSRLGSSWPEGKELLEKGTVDLEIPGFDIDAVFIILSILHGRTREIPAWVDLEGFYRLAVVTDYFQCSEAIDFFAKTWARRRWDFPKTLTTDLKKWIAISHSFGLQETLQKAIKIATYHGEGPFDTENMPIPYAIQNDIDKERTSTLDELAMSIGRQVLKNMKDPPLGKYTCNVFRLPLQHNRKTTKHGEEASHITYNPISLCGALFEWSLCVTHTCSERSCSKMEELVGPSGVEQIRKVTGKRIY